MTRSLHRPRRQRGALLATPLGIALFAGAISARVAIADESAPSPVVGDISPPVVLKDPFVVQNWRYGEALVCLTFTDTSTKTIQGIRLALRARRSSVLGDSSQGSYVDMLGSFAPGIDIKPPGRLLGTVNRNSSALKNCWEMDTGLTKTVVGISAGKVVFADGTVWLNPTPDEAMTSVTY